MIRRIGLILFILFLLIVPLLPAFYLTMGSYIGLYSMIAIGLVLLTGVTGLTSFGQAAFMGLGAYTSAVLTTQFAWSPWLTLLVALVLTFIIAFILGAITLRMGGHYLPLATIAWGDQPLLPVRHHPPTGRLHRHSRPSGSEPVRPGTAR